jgi:hypothetical protein
VCFSEYTGTDFPDNRSEVSRTGDSLDLDEISKMVSEVGGLHSFYINSSGRILHKKIGSRDIIRNNAAQPDAVSGCCLLRPEISYLVSVYE